MGKKFEFPGVREMLEIDGIRRFDPFPFPACVYFLIRGGEIIYIGQTTNLIHRLKNHSQKEHKRGFEAVYYLPTDTGNLKGLEDIYILKFRPPLNGGAHAGRFIRNRVETRMNDPQWRQEGDPIDRAAIKERAYRANIAERCEALYAERKARMKKGT